MQCWRWISLWLPYVMDPPRFCRRATWQASHRSSDIEFLFELAVDLTRACATDHRAGLLEACAGAHHLVAIGQ